MWIYNVICFIIHTCRWARCGYIVYCLFVCLCNFVRLRISPAKIKLAAWNFARWFRGVLGRKSAILGNIAPPEAQNRTNRPAASIADRRHSPPLTARSPSVEGLSSIGNTCHRHVWIYGRPRRQTYLFVCLYVYLSNDANCYTLYTLLFTLQLTQDTLQNIDTKYFNTHGFGIITIRAKEMFMHQTEITLQPPT